MHPGMSETKHVHNTVRSLKQRNVTTGLRFSPFSQNNRALQVRFLDPGFCSYAFLPGAVGVG